MDCPKCHGITESELQHSYFKADEVKDVSRCVDCGFKFYQIYRKQKESGSNGMKA
jgi:Zn ribbon nucleic-acid-binding protein